MPSLAQTLLALTFLLSAVGTHLALSPPHTTPDNNHSQELPNLPTGDFMRQFGLTGKLGTTLGPLPATLFTLHAALLTLFYPQIPSPLLLFRRHHPSDLNPKLLTWSWQTALPLALILCFAVPLRLASYSTLGKNFTFALAEPDELVTAGLYAYMQHPGYTALVTVVGASAVLTFRMDGVLGCWIPARMATSSTRKWWWRGLVMPALVAFGVYTMARRVQQEEEMMRGVFGEEWVKWHERTARFIPWVF